MPKVSTFSRANAVHNPKIVELDSIMEAIKTGKWHDRITELRKLEGAAFEQSKKLLPGFTVSGTFAERNDAGLTELSGFLQIDIDGKHNKGKKLSELREVVIAAPFVYAAFRSPSGKGIKAIVRCKPDKETHAGNHAAAVQYFADRGVAVDDRVCALSQLCFVSSDPHLYQNPGAKKITPVEVDKAAETALVEYEEPRTDEEILAACEEAWPDVFPDLWAGEFEGEDHSSADHQLIAILRENCHSNDRVCELFEQSGLYRAEKWRGNTHSYVMRSLAKCSAVKALSMMEVIPEDPADPSPPKKKRPKGVWNWETVADIGKWKPEDDKYIIKRLLYESTLSCIYGPPGSGKTFLVFSMAAAVATGREWRGHKVKQSAVLYLGLEGKMGVRKRVQAMELKGELKEDSPFATVLFERDSLNLLSDDHIQKTIRTLHAYEEDRGQKCKLLIIDTLARATPGGDENSSKDMGIAINNAQEIMDRTGCCVWLVHHTGKEVARGPRGSTALLAAFDSIFETDRCGEDSSIRVMNVKKQKDEADMQSVYYRLEIVPLGVDADLEHVSSCVVEFLEDDEIPVKKEKPGKMDNDALTALVPVAGATLDDLVETTGIARSTLQRRIKELLELGTIRKGKNGAVHRVVDPDDMFS